MLENMLELLENLVGSSGLSSMTDLIRDPCTGRCPLCLLGPQKGRCHLSAVWGFPRLPRFGDKIHRALEPTDDFCRN